VARKAIPKPSILDKMEALGFVHGERRWRDPDRGQLYTWDALHGEIEAYSRRGVHRGSLDPITGKVIKRAVKGRSIDV
jgi:hypothetical protein